MGWSCSHLAAITQEAITKRCVADTSSGNCFCANGTRYMIEWSRREHRDGAITGTILRFDGAGGLKNNTSIKINANGVISRGPATLRNMRIIRSRMTFGTRWNEEVRLWQGDETEDALYVAAVQYGEQFKPGGVNEHVGVVIYPTKVVLEDTSGHPLVSWEAGAFQVYELPETVQ